MKRSSIKIKLNVPIKVHKALVSLAERGIFGETLEDTAIYLIQRGIEERLVLIHRQGATDG